MKCNKATRIYSTYSEKHTQSFQFVVIEIEDFQYERGLKRKKPSDSHVRMESDVISDV